MFEQNKQKKLMGRCARYLKISFLLISHVICHSKFYLLKPTRNKKDLLKTSKIEFYKAFDEIIKRKVGSIGININDMKGINPAEFENLTNMAKLEQQTH